MSELSDYKRIVSDPLERKLRNTLRLKVDEIASLRARVEVMEGALRACRTAISHGNAEPRRNVREIVDRALLKRGDGDA